MSNWLNHNRKRLTTVGLGHLLYAGFSWLFDHVLYVYAVYTWGMLVGGGMMTLASLIMCILTLSVYEKMQIDWVGAGAIHAWHTRQPIGFASRLFHRISKRRKAMFLFLCVYTDPFITTAYFRQGRFDGLTRQDWRTFLYSVLVSNGYWIGVSALLGNGIAHLWQWLSTLTPLLPYVRPLSYT